METENLRDMSALFEAAQLAATDGAPNEFDVTNMPDVIRVQYRDDYTAEMLDLEQYREQPRRKSGRFTFDRTKSLIAYVLKHLGVEADGNPVSIYARSESFVAVLNGHSQLAPGWADHVATYTLKRTTPWSAWLKADSTWMEQEAFADFLEDRIPDISSPAGGVLMEIATRLHVKSKLNFQSRINRSNGQVQLTYEEEIDGTAGDKGELAIPETLELVLTPFEGADKTIVTARFRWRIAGGKAAFKYSIGEQAESVTRDALERAAAEIEEATGLTVLYGVPTG